MKTLVLTSHKMTSQWDIQDWCNDLPGRPAPKYEDWVVDKIVQVNVVPSRLRGQWFTHYFAVIVVEVSPIPAIQASSSPVTDVSHSPTRSQQEYVVGQAFQCAVCGSSLLQCHCSACGAEVKCVAWGQEGVQLISE